jgi:hypothetical protein
MTRPVSAAQYWIALSAAPCTVELPMNHRAGPAVSNARVTPAGTNGHSSSENPT